jgi:hypothetical protein
MIINQNQISKPEELKRSNKIRKIINDGINLNFSKTNELIKKYGDNSKQIKKINYTKYITKGNNYYFLKYLVLTNIDVLCNFCSIKDQSVLIDLKNKLNNDNELIKHFDKNFEIFLLENKFPFSKKFKEMHNYNYINDNKYSSICLDEIKCGKKSKEKSNEIKIFHIIYNYINNINISKDNTIIIGNENEFIEKKRNLNEKNFCDGNLKFNLSTNNSSNIDNINIDNNLNYDCDNNFFQNDNLDFNLEDNFGQESFLSDDEKRNYEFEKNFKFVFK